MYRARKGAPDLSFEIMRDVERLKWRTPRRVAKLPRMDSHTFSRIKEQLQSGLFAQ